MNLSYLKEFLVLSETGNYLSAAGKLFIAQSTLSRHIKAMEEELGVVLFERNTRNVSLSEFGKTFLPYAKKILELETEYQFELFHYKRKISGVLSIGFIPSMAQYHITDFLALFREKCPDYSLDVMEGDSVELTERLMKGEIDLAFIRLAANAQIDGLFDQITYAEDTLAAIMPAGHVLAGRPAVHMGDLRDETLLLLSSDTFMFRLCLSACQSAQFEPKIGFTGHRSGNILSMVENGFGIALLTRHPIQKKLTDRLVMVPIEPEIKTVIRLIYRKDKRLSAPARQFLSMLRDFTASPP